MDVKIPEVISYLLLLCLSHCWTPKYRFRIFQDIIADAVEDRICSICEWKEVKIEELNIQKDHIYLVCSIPPKLSVSDVFHGDIEREDSDYAVQELSKLEEEALLG